MPGEHAGGSPPGAETHSPSPGATNEQPTSEAAPSPSIDPELGVQPTPAFPRSEAIGIGTLRITAPRSEVVRFWLSCEWPTTERVYWLYTGGSGHPSSQITLFGESVFLYVSDLLDGDPFSVILYRSGDVARYTIDRTSKPVLAHLPDWTAGSLTFEHLRIDPEAWPVGPLPTPTEVFERPFGGDPTNADLAGAFEWTCGPRPASVPLGTVPTPRPVRTDEPGPQLELPHVKLTASGESRQAISGCGTTWGTGGQVSAGATCGGPGVPVPPFAASLPMILEIPANQDLVFSLPSGFHFEEWSYAYVDQATAELYRGAEPSGIVLADRDRSASASTVRVNAPPRGDWMIRFTFNATDGDVVVHGTPDYFRVAIT